MKIFINIIFFVFGICLPLTIIFVAILKKKSANKLNNLFSKCLIALIIFSIFYIIKIGGIYLINKDTSKATNDIKKTSLNASLKASTTTSLSTTNTSSISTTKKNTTKQTIKTTINSIKTSDNDSAKIKVIDGVTYVSGILIANKTYPLPSNFVPKNTHKNADGLKYCSECIDNEAWNAFNEMKSDATSLGLNIYIQSGYRSYDLQKELYNKYVARDGKIAADTYSARPGHSEHQTGLAFDLNSITDAFQYTNEGKWVNENCYKYGFILRYPKGKENETGYKYESWHLRYIGKDLARVLYNNGTWRTLEEYLDISSKYEN